MQNKPLAVRNFEHRLSKNQTAEFARCNNFCNCSNISQKTSSTSSNAESHVIICLPDSLNLAADSLIINNFQRLKQENPLH